MPLLSSKPAVSSTTGTPQAGSAPSAIPSIRLISATPSATGMSSEASTSFNRSLEESWATMPSIPSPLAPREQDPNARRRLVPKKSKLSILGMGMTMSRKEDRARDFSDVVRRVGVVDADLQGSGSARGGFEIYVDPTIDPDIGEIVMVKKKKSRVGLDGMNWGAMGEVTNVPKVVVKEKEGKEKDGLLRVKNEEKDSKWWSIGRGRKDSKEKEKKEKESKISNKPVEYIHDPYPRSKTPEPFKPAVESRGRFNSLGSGVLLNSRAAPSVSQAPDSIRGVQAYHAGQSTAVPLAVPMPDDDEDNDRLSEFTYSRSGTPTAGGLLAPPPGGGGSQTQGSIAIRAIRSVRSLARMGSWAQLKNTPAPGDDDEAFIAVKEKSVKKKSTKENKKPAEEKEKDEKKKSVKKKSTKKDKEEKPAKDKSSKDKSKAKDKPKAATVRLSSSSFEIGALTASPGPSASPANPMTLGPKKQSTLLGLGLPSTMRLPSVRAGSTASSKYDFGAPTTAVAPLAPAAVITSPNDVIANIINNNRLSVESARSANVNRASSIISSGSSLRPLSTTSTNSRLSSGSGSAVSVRWDEEGLETVREQRKKEREGRVTEEAKDGSKTTKEERRSSRESRRSSEGRRRTPITAVFPEVKQMLEEGEIGEEMVRTNEEWDIDEERRRMFNYPILTIEEATSDGHGRMDDDDELIGSEDGSTEGSQEQEEQKPEATPVKKARARPLSEQLLGRSRPKPMHEDDEGVISILDAATNDLALLINNLDLQATPSTPDMTPLRPSASLSPSPTPVSTLEKVNATDKNGAEYDGSPKKRKTVADSPLGLKSVKKLMGDSLLRQTSTASISSLRPYAQSRGYSAPKTVSTTAAKTTVAASNNNTANAALISKQIAPWSTLMKGLSPVKEKHSPATILAKATSTATPPSSSTFRPGHKRTMTPAPEPEPEPVLQPLRPARSRVAIKAKLLQVPSSPAGNVHDNVDMKGEEHPRAPSSLTFGSRSSSGSLTPVFKRIQEYEHGQDLKRSSLVPSDALNLNSSRSSRGSRSSSKGSRSSYGSQINTPIQFNDGYNNQSDADDDREYTVPIARETRRVLGMSGTMGGSDVSCYQMSEPLDVSDPDSDVPDELRFILATNSERGSVVEIPDGDERVGVEMEMDERTEDSMDVEVEVGRSQASHLPPSLALELNLPVFRASLVDEQDNHLEIDDCPNSPTSEEDTKKSFDFTGELKKLNESGGSDRRSFVEQLENAFRTPAKVDLRYDLNFGSLGAGAGGRSLVVEVPPVPELPLDFRMAVDAESSGSSGYGSSGSSGFDAYGYPSASQIVDVKLPSMTEKTRSEIAQESNSNFDSKSQFDMFSASRIVDIKEPTILQGSDSLGSSNDAEDSLFRDDSSPGLKPIPAASTVSRTSDGELNTSFRFGGMPRSESSTSLPNDEKPLTLSDIIPPPSHARSISGCDSYMLDGLEDDSVLKSIYAKMIGGMPAQRPRVNSGSSIRQSAQEKRKSIYKAASRPTSGISFEGFNSFEEVRRGFEFSDDRPAFYPPPAVAASAAASRRAPHRRHESAFSIASVSSYGHVINSGSNDPFDYGLPSLRERPSSEDMTSISMSMSVDDTFAFLANKPRRRVESDASSFYFRPIQQNNARGHRRRESNMSVSSQAPPISLYNRSFGHRRNDSTASSSSVAMSYVKHGANGGISAWAKHRKDQSVDSVLSDFSGMHLGRPGLGDKMFDTQAPLEPISASPPESANASQQHFGHRSSFDSILDEEQRLSMEDSLFEKTGHRTSVSSDSVFGDDFSHPYQGGLLPPNQFRPLSVLSRNSVHSPMREDDTMISMLGGGHVRRSSVGSIFEASPCVRVEKRKHSAVHMYKGQENYESPNKARIVEKPSIASTSSFQFGGERMIKAKRGLLERQSLEDSCLIADGEDHTSAYVPVFSKPGPATRSRSSTCTSSSGSDTPPLSASDGSSLSEGSQSSIDLSQINIALSNATHPMSTVSRNRARARARGTGHRRRYSKSHISRSSVYETIEEEMPNSNQTSPAHSLLSKKSSLTTRQAVFIVDSDTVSIDANQEESVWDDERGIVALRKYYALRDEAKETVTESRRQWRDTPFSLFAIQTFQAPGSPAGMQALLQHSVQNYGPLPLELHPRRIRTSSRPSPYPQRVSKATLSPEKTRCSMVDLQKTPVLQPVAINKNLMTAAPSLEALKPFSPLMVDIEPKRENAFGLAPDVRPRVGSTARRTALGWSKRSTGKSSTDHKENAVGAGTVMTPGDTLRLNRPRPRGRLTPAGRTPATQSRPIRV